MARGLSIVLCFAIATAFRLEVSKLPDLDGRGVSFEISPDDLELNLTWCEMRDEPSRCASAYDVIGGVNITDLQPYTKYNITAEAASTNDTEFQIFETDRGTPTTLFNITVKEVGPFWISLAWTPIDRSKLNGEPSGYKIVYCNTTCEEEETHSPEMALDSLKPKTLYNIRLWAFNIDSFGQRLENEQYATIIQGITAPDSQTSLIFVITGSVGVLAVIAGFILYMRKSRRNRRKTHRFNIVKTYEDSFSVPSTRNSV